MCMFYGDLLTSTYVRFIRLYHEVMMVLMSLLTKTSVTFVDK